MEKPKHKPKDRPATAKAGKHSKNGAHNKMTPLKRKQRQEESERRQTKTDPDMRAIAAYRRSVGLQNLTESMLWNSVRRSLLNFYATTK